MAEASSMEKKLADLSLGKEEDEGLKEVECGWDVSLRTQPRRASITPSVSLRENNMGRNCVEDIGKQVVGNNGRGTYSFDPR
ncbi:hypothetical protein Goari_027284 [Gossypium aridum]|uniref:Uncharacterized protein n=1 Tax=Gossypium aridum TaxID=34290 RepID=A0A7J8YSK2_GOSAI|nr:hypothetical protein [Gossypium aridum]